MRPCSSCFASPLIHPTACANLLTLLHMPHLYTPLLSPPAGPAGEDYVVLPSPPGPITQQLQQLVQQLQEATPVADWQ